MSEFCEGILPETARAWAHWCASILWAETRWDPTYHWELRPHLQSQSTPKSRRSQKSLLNGLGPPTGPPKSPKSRKNCWCLDNFLECSELSDFGRVQGRGSTLGRHFWELSGIRVDGREDLKPTSQKCRPHSAYAPPPSLNVQALGPGRHTRLLGLCFVACQWRKLWLHQRIFGGCICHTNDGHDLVFLQGFLSWVELLAGWFGGGAVRAVPVFDSDDSSGEWFSLCFSAFSRRGGELRSTYVESRSTYVELWSTCVELWSTMCLFLQK